MARQSKGKPKTEQTANNPKLLKAIEKQLKRVRKRQKAKYNGVVGSLPEWVPSPLKYEFEAVRDILLDKYDHEDLHRYMNGRKRMFTEKGFRWLPYYPENIEEKLDALIYIRDLVEVGEKNGKKATYDAYLGKGGYEIYRGAIFSEKNKKAAKAKRSGPFHDLISSILKSNPDFGCKEVLRELEKCTDGEVIVFINDEEIEWTNENGKTKNFKISSLPSLVSRLKKFLR